MKTLIEHFDKLYPNYSSKEFEGCHVVREKENECDKAFHELTINDIEGYEIPNKIAKDSTSFYTKANSRQPMNHDCDGIFFSEYSGQKYLFLCELKSTFASQEIQKAKEQIIGSYLKMHSLLSLLQSYRKDEIEVRGLIVSFKPNVERLLAIEKKSESDKSCHFCSCLYRDNKYVMPQKNSERYYAPLCVPGLTIHYVGVPDSQQEYAINFNSLFGE